MKKILTIALTLCLLVTALAGCGSSAPAAPDPDRRPHGSSGGSHGRIRRRGRQTDRRL